MKLHEQIIFTIKSIRCNVISNLMKSGYVISVALQRGTNAVVMQCTTVQAPTHSGRVQGFTNTRFGGFAEVMPKIAGSALQTRGNATNYREANGK